MSKQLHPNVQNATPVISAQTPMAGSLGATPAKGDKIQSAEPEDDGAKKDVSGPFSALSKIVEAQIPDLVKALPVALLEQISEAVDNRIQEAEEAEENARYAKAADALGISVADLKARLNPPKMVVAGGRKAKGEIKRPRRDPVSADEIKALIAKSLTWIDSQAEQVSWASICEANGIDALPVAQMEEVKEGISSRHNGKAGRASGYLAKS